MQGAVGMKLKTKRIRVIEMTHEEHANFLRLMREAEEGHTVNYAETRLSDGSYLGVSLVKKHEDDLSQRDY